MNNELYHYGILGQKWGIRRYQNSDGSLTSEGKKRYRKEVKEANKEAFEIGREATAYGRAAKYAMNRVARKEDRADRKLRKDPDQLKESTQRAVDNAKAAEKAALRIATEYAKYEKEARQHVNGLMKKYGKEKVKDISYKDVKLSKSAASKYGKDSIKVVNENVNNLSDWVSAGLGSVAFSAMAAVMQVPVAMIFTPPSKNNVGSQIARDYYIDEWQHNYDKRYFS